MKVTVVGAGSWGTALAVVLSRNEHDVTIWAREPETAHRINNFHDNHDYLPMVTLPDSIRCSTDLSECFHQTELVVMATPSHTIREVAGKAKQYFTGNESVVCVAKGIENGTFLRPSEILTEVLSDTVNPDKIGVLSGPSHAEEVCQFRPTTVVSAAYSRGTARLIQQAFLTPMFRVYVNNDIIGVEIGAAVKNVIAIAAGIVDGAGFGDNAKAALITRGLAEITRLGVRLGAAHDTFAGLAGMGDLIVTCTSAHSRNRYVGYHIGKGQKLHAIIDNMKMVAEGVKTTESIHGFAKKTGVEMPICEAVYKMLFEEKDPKDAVYELMTREAKDESMFS
jgi:glycerol-3-phosphate dehydrogenase (NAD(P)+)